ncbi:hypothetical protein GCM10027275_44880 [Rhabdobacter roseus]|uniref:Uncharacterized protein n=1 Tax=Rhabdobacter roseus TaxID=1655419 RepID=A0A840TZ12_9BACT|nr:hypothetical protein [Rhabdobacter roseus]MBB5286842.1 hypothetical protein [Rhabdobacter roseus]
MFHRGSLLGWGLFFCLVATTVVHGQVRLKSISFKYREEITDEAQYQESLRKSSERTADFLNGLIKSENDSTGIAGLFSPQLPPVCNRWLNLIIVCDYLLAILLKP